MLRRSVKIQLLAFVVISLLGISYVSSRYVGLTSSLFGSNACTVSVDYPDSGGIFSGAEVTYRGVAVGRVGQLHLRDDGVRVDLRLNHCSHPAVPKAGTLAFVSDRSAVGEQYVNLVPKTDSGPYLKGGDVLHMSTAQLPVPTQVLLTNLDLLVRSVNTDNLSTAIDELAKAFNGRGPDLQRLLDSGTELLQAAQANLPQTIDLINKSKTVLQTQLDEGSAIRSWTHDLSLLTAQLKASDSDIRNLLDTGPANLATINSLVTDNRDDLGVMLANLATTGRVHRCAGRRHRPLRPGAEPERSAALRPGLWRHQAAQARRHRPDRAERRRPVHAAARQPVHRARCAERPGRRSGRHKRGRYRLPPGHDRQHRRDRLDVGRERCPAGRQIVGDPADPGLAVERMDVG
jgi:virulence factor Mce-like protein